MRRVVVTGMGMVTPVGRDVESTWAALLAGRGGVGPITLFDASTFPTRIAAEVNDFRLDDYLHDAGAVGRALAQQQVRAGRGAMADERLRAGRGQAGPRPTAVRRLPRLGRRAAGLPPVRRPGPASDPRGPASTRPVHRPRAQASCTRSARPSRSRGRPSGHLASVFGARGPNATCLTACAASCPGDRRGGRGDPPRRRRRDARRRHAQHDPPVRPHRLHPPDGDVDPQRRARPAPAGRSTATATASSSARGAACSSSRSWSTPRPGAPSSTARSPATARRPTPSA